MAAVLRFPRGFCQETMAMHGHVTSFVASVGAIW
jgi:hypothetical protein